MRVFGVHIYVAHKIGDYSETRQTRIINQSNNQKSKGLLGTLFPSVRTVTRFSANFLSGQRPPDYPQAQRVLGSFSPKGHADASLSKSHILNQLLCCQNVQPAPHLCACSYSPPCVFSFNREDLNSFNQSSAKENYSEQPHY